MLRISKRAESFFLRSWCQFKPKSTRKPPQPALLNQLCHIHKIHCVPGWYEIISLWVIYGSPETNSQRKHEKH